MSSITITTAATTEDILAAIPGGPPLVFPVVKDPGTFPRIPVHPTPDASFTYSEPQIITGIRSRVRIVKARHKLVVLDCDLAELYETTVDIVNKAAMWNACCFSRPTCFRLSNAEWHHLKQETNLGDIDRGNWLCAPLAFTKEGANAVARILDTFEAIRGSVLVWRNILKLEAAKP